MAMLIAQGGSGFPFLAEPVYHYMATGKCDGSLIDVSELPDPTLQFVIEKVSITSSVVDSLCLLCCMYNVGQSSRK